MFADIRKKIVMWGKLVWSHNLRKDFLHSLSARGKGPHLFSFACLRPARCLSYPEKILNECIIYEWITLNSASVRDSGFSMNSLKLKWVYIQMNLPMMILLNLFFTTDLHSWTFPFQWFYQWLCENQTGKLVNHIGRWHLAGNSSAFARWVGIPKRTSSH